MFWRPSLVNYSPDDVVWLAQAREAVDKMGADERIDILKVTI